MSEARRSQRERREETISRLVDATVDTIAEAGYARTTVHAITERAGLSQGALFRHFASRRDLVIAAAMHVAEQHTEQIQAHFADTELTTENLGDALRLVRTHARSRPNRVWHELMAAARTDDALHEALQPAIEDFQRRTAVTAFKVAGPAVADPAQLLAALRVVISFFDGEATLAALLPDEDAEDAALEALCGWLQTLLENRELEPHDPSEKERA